MDNQLKSIFPPPESADEYGVVAYSKGINCAMLADAYRNAIFPWPFGEDEEYIPWTAPLMRGVLMLDEFHIPKSFKRELKKLPFTCRIDTDFKAVISACASVVRKEGAGTWITGEMIDAYCEFHKLGFAHSFETYDDSGRLVGGLYGVESGRVFCGESMFHYVSGASKFAFVAMVEFLKANGFVLVDTQMVTPVTAMFGAKEMPSAEYLKLFRQLQNS
jgi:leucyl/phenylalanyl-tRNA--protein transferase